MPTLENPLGDERPYVEILLRADPTLPRRAPLRLVLSADENLVIVGDRVDPLDLRAALELLKQVRTRYGRNIPGGSIEIAAPPHRPSTMRARDAESYEQLLWELARAPMEVINGRPAARHKQFQEAPAVEVAVSESTLTALLKPAP